MLRLYMSSLPHAWEGIYGGYTKYFLPGGTIPLAAGHKNFRLPQIKSSNPSQQITDLQIYPNCTNLKFSMANSSGKGTITHVIFDMDGLLLGNFIEHLHCVCTLFYLIEIKLIDWEQIVYAKIMGEETKI